MTATAQQVISTAAHEIGYVEGGGPDGHSGNITKYWAELYPAFQGQSWCMAFQRWVEKHATAPWLPVSTPYYCPTYVTYARQHGLWDTDGHYNPGDLVFFDWSGQGVAEHVGLVVSDDGHTITTIEGNTSSGDAGSQANGGGVYRRQRPHGSTVMGALSYHKFLAAPTPSPTPPPPPPRHPIKHNPYQEPTSVIGAGCRTDAVAHHTWVHWVQWAVGVPCDGVWGPQTNHAVRLFQHYHGLGVDGIVGPQTRAVLARVTH